MPHPPTQAKFCAKKCVHIEIFKRFMFEQEGEGWQRAQNPGPWSLWSLVMDKYCTNTIIILVSYLHAFQI